MKLSYCPYLKFEFRNAMNKNGLVLEPSIRVIVNGKKHLFAVKNSGKLRIAYYVADFDDFDGGMPILIGSYGFEDSSTRHSFSRSIHELISQ